MNPWVESLAVLLLAAGGMLVGAWFSRLPKPWWLFGYFLPLLVVISFDIANRCAALAFVPPVSWLMLGRNKFAATGFIAAMMLTTPMLKMPKPRDRVAVSILMLGAVLGTSVWPFLAPVFNQKQLAGLVTNLDGEGVCHQSTDYTCGPAAAVTALRKLGFKAEEGEIARLAHTTSATGTLPDVLARVLQDRYGNDGLVSQYRVFKSPAELKGCLPVLAVVKFNLLVDHYVTVLDINDREITIGDPLQGLDKLTIAEFTEKWRFTGVALRRK
jgi:predicted double-glycine peptidase